MYNAVLVVVDALTKYAFYLPCCKDIDAPQLADLMYERVFPIIGNPQRLVSDRGTLFTSRYWSTLCYRLRTKRQLSTAFHPQSDGQTERQNQEIQYYLRAYINFLQDDWVEWLPMAQFCYNSSTHSATKVPPAQALMGFIPQSRIDVDIDPLKRSAPKAEDRV